MARIRFVCVIDPTRKYCKPIEHIFISRRDKAHIIPVHALDFDEHAVYRVYWRACNTECKIEDKCCSYYKANIISLGESEKDAIKAADKREKRFRFRKKVTTSTESTFESDGSEVEKELSLPEKRKAVKRKANDINSKNAISKFKKNLMLNARENLQFDEDLAGEEDENDSACVSVKAITLLPRKPLSLRQADSNNSSRSNSRSKCKSKSPSRCSSNAHAMSTTKTSSRSTLNCKSKPQSSQGQGENVAQDEP